MRSDRETITCIINHTIIMMDGNFMTLTQGAAFFWLKVGCFERGGPEHNTKILSFSQVHFTDGK